MLNQEQKDFVKNAIEIAWIVACKGQITPDGKSCIICQDIGHQAFECPHNIGLQTLKLGEEYFNGKP